LTATDISKIASVSIRTIINWLTRFGIEIRPQSDWIENKEQDPSKIEDITKALPYVEENYRISYSEAEKYYIVTYPGYKSFGEIELKTVLWFKQNTNLKSVQIKYGEIGGVTKDYDLNISAEEILKGNKYYQQTVKDAEYTEMEI